MNTQTWKRNGSHSRYDKHALLHKLIQTGKLKHRELQCWEERTVHAHWAFDLSLYSLQPLRVWSALCQSNSTAQQWPRAINATVWKWQMWGQQKEQNTNLIQSQHINLTKEESNHLWVSPDELVKQTSCRHVCEELIRSPVQNTFYIPLITFHCLSNLSLQV